MKCVEAPVCRGPGPAYPFLNRDQTYMQTAICELIRATKRQTDEQAGH